MRFEALTQQKETKKCDSEVTALVKEIKGHGSCILKKKDLKLICTLGSHYDLTNLQHPMGRGKTNVF